MLKKMAVSMAVVLPVVLNTAALMAESDNNLSATLSASTEQTDNALKSSTNKLSERQDTLGAAVAAAYQNSWMEFDAGYALRSISFEKDSQPDRNILEGDASLQLGKSDDVVDLLLQTSRRAKLNQPDQIDLDQNLDEKQVMSAIPTVRAKLGSVDTLALQGNYTTVDFRYNPNRNSQRAGASVYWTHHISAVDYLRVLANQTQVDFEQDGVEDYKSARLSLLYAAQLRDLRYELEAGVDQAGYDNGDEDFSSPAYRVKLNYKTGFHQLELLAEAKITDSSLGDSNAGELDGQFGSTSDGVAIDQLERTNLNFNWTTTLLCQRCDAGVFLGWREDQYRVFDEDNVEQNMGVNLEYRLTARSGLKLRFAYRIQEFESVTREDFTRNNTHLEYYHALGKDVDFRFFIDAESRRNKNSGSKYSENSFGISLSYTL